MKKSPSRNSPTESGGRRKLRVPRGKPVPLPQPEYTDVVRYLLESGAKLHGNVFIRPDLRRIGEVMHSKELVYTISIFHASNKAEDVIALLEVFLGAGWYPNQSWLSS